MEHFEIDLEPIGRRVMARSGESVLQAAQRAGVALNATCGGEGVCGRCLVQVMAGEFSQPTWSEQDLLGTELLGQGWRLACQLIPQGTGRIYIPPGSMATNQRIQTEGQELAVHLDPAVRGVEITIGKRDGVETRLQEALDMPGLVVPTALQKTLVEVVETVGQRASAFLHGKKLVALRPAGATPLGLAVDLGTTKLAAYLVDLASGVTLATGGVMNPQIAFGEDVMARLHHALDKQEGAEQLRLAAVEAVNGLAGELCAQAGRQRDDIAETVVAGNTAMHHLFLGLPVRQLGLAPYAPAESQALDLDAGEKGLKLAAGANLHLLPNIAGFVGGDHVAMLLGSGMMAQKGITLGMDIGTNTEISLLANGRHYACSTASGPAFEGAHIRHGMRAAPGAIEKVLIREGKLHLQTIGGMPATGLCGSGILDLVAQMRRAGLLNSRGALQQLPGEQRIRQGDGGLEYVLVTGSDGSEITFNRRDVNEIQLAKGAMSAGVHILLAKAGIDEEQIETVIIAGAFGTYLDVQSGIDIGMLPALRPERFIQVGNAAGTGARMALLSVEKRREAERIARRVEYVELASERSFPSVFARCLLLTPGSAR